MRRRTASSEAPGLFVTASGSAETAEDFRAAADHSVRLAKLDEYFRAGLVDPECERVEPNVRDEVLAMLEHTPFDRLSHPSRIALNPTFGRWSALVGGADADLIRGDLLIDLKTTANRYLERAYVRQALGYLILARRACARDASLPKPRRVGIYFGRFGFLWVSPRVSEHPRYREVARAFVARAKQPDDQGPPGAIGAPRRAPIARSVRSGCGSHREHHATRRMRGFGGRSVSAIARSHRSERASARR